MLDLMLGMGVIASHGSPDKFIRSMIADNLGGYFHTLSLDSLYTTSAGTTNVVAVGDPVGLVESQVNNGVTLTSPISAERPIYRVTPSGTPYLEFLSTSRVTFDFGQPFIGAMVVSTLAGSYIVEIDSPAQFVWGQYMPVRNVTGIVFIEGFDIESVNGEKLREALTAVTKGQLDWDAGRTSFQDSFRNNSISKLPMGITKGMDSAVLIRRMFMGNSSLRFLPSDFIKNLLAFTRTDTDTDGPFRDTSVEDIPDGFFDKPIKITRASAMFSRCNFNTIRAGMFTGLESATSLNSMFGTNSVQFVEPNCFDGFVACTNYSIIFTGGQNALTPQSVENVLVSIAFSANTNDLNNGTLGIRGDGNPLTPEAETARQQLIARGWTLTLQNITGL